MDVLTKGLLKIVKIKQGKLNMMKHIKNHIEQEIKYRAVHSIVKCILFKIVRDIPCKGGHAAPASH